jgi:predicted NodU family carbamoyl transferase
MFGKQWGREPTNRMLAAYRKSPEYKMERARKQEMKSKRFGSMVEQLAAEERLERFLSPPEGEIDQRPEWLKRAVEDVRENRRLAVMRGR